MIQYKNIRVRLLQPTLLRQKGTIVELREPQAEHLVKMKLAEYSPLAQEQSAPEFEVKTKSGKKPLAK